MNREHPIIFSGPMVRAILDGRKTQTRRIVDLERLRVRLRSSVRSGLPGDATEAGPGIPHRARLNQNAAVSLSLGETTLGVKPGEFDFVCQYADGRTHLADHGNGRKNWTMTPTESRLWVKESWRTGISLDEYSPSKIGEKCIDAGYSKPWAPLKYDADGDERNANGVMSDFGGAWGKVRVSIHMPRWASRITLEVAEVRVERLNAISKDDAIAEGARHFADIPDPHPYKQGARWSMFDPPNTHHCLHGPQMAFASAWNEINGPDAWETNPWVWAITFRKVQP
jgi:hypothetical protein